MSSSIPASTTIPQEEVEQLRTSLAAALSRVSAAASPGQDVTLIAVSKTKPVALLRAAYDAGQRDFGENYVQELVTKASELPGDIRWHFIGALQTNKANVLLSIPNLSSIHTVDRVKAVRAIQKAAGRAERSIPLDVFVQVNIDSEEQKAGCAIAEVDAVVDEIRSCDKLAFRGLMCIGDPSKDTTAGFIKMREIRTSVAQKYSMDESNIQLSMGMSGDFENAVREGATAVRVGSLIFGRRLYPAPDK